MEIIEIIIMGILFLIGIGAGFFIRAFYAKKEYRSVEQETLRLKANSKKEAEEEKDRILLAADKKLLQEKRNFEKEQKDRLVEFSQKEKRLQQKEDNLEKKLTTVSKTEQSLQDQKSNLIKREKDLESRESNLESELEKISGLTKEQAKEIIIKSMENQARHDGQIIANKIEQETIAIADKRARTVLITTMQRLATEVSTEITITSVNLPNEEMKGRIIGKEGRNIRTLENLTGVDIIIDETPEAVVLSCFDPIRKVIAKTSLERLVSDGRIHPSRIEEVVQKVTKEITQIVYEEGEKVLFELGIHNMHPELIRALGRLHFRSSYGQNVLAHSKEVAIIAGQIASEIGCDIELARRGALLHDIGKGIETEGDKNHAETGAEVAKRYNEDHLVVNIIGAHHNDIESESLEAIICQIADAISASRPGARRETLDNYIKRLEQLERIANGFKGVDKCFAIQAGREVRIIVNPDEINDEEAHSLARNIAEQIEKEMQYPGRIKIAIIRETRIIDYAR